MNTDFIIFIFKFLEIINQSYVIIFTGRNEESEDKKNKRETVCYSFCKTDGCNAAYKNDAGFLLTIFFSTYIVLI